MHDCLSEQKSDETFHSTDEMHHENNVLSRILLQRVKSLVTCFGIKSPRHKKTLKKKTFKKNYDLCISNSTILYIHIHCTPSQIPKSDDE